MPSQEAPSKSLLNASSEPYVVCCVLYPLAKVTQRITSHQSFLLLFTGQQKLTFLLPGKAKALCVVSHYKPFLSIQKGRYMQHYGDNFVVRHEVTRSE